MASREQELAYAMRDEGSLARIKTEGGLFNRIVTIERVFWGKQITRDILRAKVIDYESGVVRYMCYCELEPF